MLNWPAVRALPRAGRRLGDPAVGLALAAIAQVEIWLGGPEGSRVAAYRVVQEALTNTIKHAHASRAQVLVEYKAGELRVEVVDEGRGAQADGLTGGHGLVGMRERVRLYEGVLTAAPRRGEGYAVSARFPLSERSR